MARSASGLGPIPKAAALTLLASLKAVLAPDTRPSIGAAGGRASRCTQRLAMATAQPSKEEICALFTNLSEDDYDYKKEEFDEMDADQVRRANHPSADAPSPWFRLFVRCCS